MNTPARAAVAGTAAVVLLGAAVVACESTACAATSPRPAPPRVTAPRPAPAPAPRPPLSKTPTTPNKPRPHHDDGPDLLPLPPFADNGQCQ
ncbi:hypothetical protein RI578_22800 [Streptomyces sp. BB1-1-1]|uniref:hypothetical protein n=1 Tax=Streptomyces sp. BB1-1-1 TaxID=3074430 RepID=UPI002877F601|nr:hypothetical protein [Streptomyces sp. BB1-1-1]WND36940.1 hypothetical protein RI578_22800 [Streptomyces sp. BB1-1-1]